VRPAGGRKGFDSLVFARYLLAVSDAGQQDSEAAVGLSSEVVPSVCAQADTGASPDSLAGAAAPASARAPTVLGTLFHIVRRLTAALAGLYLLILALDLLKKGAAGLNPILAVIDVAGPAGGLGFGWLMACLLLSGSPVAAIALTLLAAGTLNPEASFAMIGGSRLGASFVVLVIGVLDDLRSRRSVGRGSYVGVSALATTAVIYVPALIIGYAAFEHGVLAGLRFEGRQIASITSMITEPLVGTVDRDLPTILVFVLGIGGLLTAFKAFDLVLPHLSGTTGALTRIGQIVFRPWAMFLIGAGVTALTLSVSVSLSILVPLRSKGYIRRENLCPYIMGANITTFIDTLLAGALVGHPDAVRIVALQMASVSLLSLPIVLLFPHAFERTVDRLAGAVTASAWRQVLFVAVLLTTPLVLMLI